MKLSKIIKVAEHAGWTVKKCSSGHVLFFAPNKADGIVTVGGTPSDRRAVKNIKRDFKNAGLRL